MARLATTADDFRAALDLWNGYLPQLDAAYGAEHVNHERRLAAIEREAATNTEFWLSDRGDAYFALRKSDMDGTPAWEFFEACFRQPMNDRRFRQVAAELLTQAVRDRGVALGFRWAFCDTSPLLAVRSKSELDAVAVSSETRQRKRFKDGGIEFVAEERRVFDLTRFAVAVGGR